MMKMNLLPLLLEELRPLHPQNIPTLQVSQHICHFFTFILVTTESEPSSFIFLIVSSVRVLPGSGAEPEPAEGKGDPRIHQ